LGYIEERLVALDYAGASDDLLPEPVQELAGGGAHLFSQWPNPEVPILGRAFTQSGTGTAGSSTSACPGGRYSRGTIPRNTPHGIYTRLQSHASGRRSGDQFCVYVPDRFVLPILTRDDIAGIVSGRHQMDAHVRRYIHEQLLYRYTIVPNGRAALAIEGRIKSGGAAIRTSVAISWRCGPTKISANDPSSTWWPGLRGEMTIGERR
jgi:hypothetical protein